MNRGNSIVKFRMLLVTCVFVLSLVSCAKKSNHCHIQFELPSAHPSGASIPVTLISWDSSGRDRFLMMAEVKLEDGFNKVDLTRMELKNVINSTCGWGASELSEVEDFAKDGGFEIRDPSGKFIGFSSRLGDKLLFPSSTK